jgi:hypothetical protein
VAPAKLVARYRDGRVLKGYASDFAPDRPQFHLVPATEAGSPAGPVAVPLDDLKALFFVRDFGGDADYQERKRFDALDGRGGAQGRRVAVAFADGEVLVGYTVAYDPRRLGFFLYPADPRSNNLRVFAVATSVRTVSVPERDERPAGMPEPRPTGPPRERDMVDPKLVGNLHAMVGVLRQAVGDWDAFLSSVDALTQDNARLRARLETLERECAELSPLRQQRAEDLRTIVQLRGAHQTMVRELDTLRREHDTVRRERESAAAELETILHRLQP